MRRLIGHAKPFENETGSKARSKSENEQLVIESYQNNRPVNLSAHEQDVNKICAGFARLRFIGFIFHTAFWVDNKHNTGETTS